MRSSRLDAGTTCHDGPSKTENAVARKSLHHPKAQKRRCITVWVLNPGSIVRRKRHFSQSNPQRRRFRDTAPLDSADSCRSARAGYSTNQPRIPVAVFHGFSMQARLPRRERGSRLRPFAVAESSHATWPWYDAKREADPRGSGRNREQRCLRGDYVSVQTPHACNPKRVFVCGKPRFSLP